MRTGSTRNTCFGGKLRDNYFTEQCNGSEAGSLLRLGVRGTPGDTQGGVKDSRNPERRVLPVRIPVPISSMRTGSTRNAWLRGGLVWRWPLHSGK